MSVKAFFLNRQVQLPFELLGRFIRASVPGPSTSCNGTIAVLANRRQHRTNKVPMNPFTLGVEVFHGQVSFGADLFFGPRRPRAGETIEQPTVVSLSCVPL